MNWGNEPKEILKGALKKEYPVDAISYVMVSLLELSENSVNLSDLRQLIFEIKEEIV